MSEGESMDRSGGSIWQQALCGGNSPGLLFMGPSPNWAACEDFEHTYNSFFPLLCLSSQLEMGRIDQSGLALLKWESRGCRVDVNAEL